MSDESVEILLAEDNSEDAEMTLRALRRNNLANNVRWVKDGAEALDYLFSATTRPPKLVLLDIKMPKVDGIEVLRRVKADPATQKIPVVVMTSSNEQSDITESYQLGANGYVVKPVEFGAFVEAISKIGMFWLMVNRGLRG